MPKKLKVELFYDDVQDLLELTPKKRCPFHHRGLECKSRKQANLTLEYRISRAKVNRILPRECTGHSKNTLPTTQEKTLHIVAITRWPTPKSD